MVFDNCEDIRGPRSPVHCSGKYLPNLIVSIRLFRNALIHPLLNCRSEIGSIAACLLAGRVAAPDPESSILVIAVGQDNYGNHNVVSPGLLREHLRPGGTTGLFYTAEGERQFAGKDRIVPVGRLFSVGSSVNLML